MLDPLTDDAPLRALHWALGETALDTRGAVVFFGARPAAWLGAHWQCEQPFRPLADALQAQGHSTHARLPPQQAALSLILPPRSREAARALLARAVQNTVEGGQILLAASNDAGARSHEHDLHRLLGNSRSLSKWKSRIVLGHCHGHSRDAALFEQWLALDEPRQLHGTHGPFWSRPGLFAWDRVDAASALLAEHLPDTLTGRVADLGAGWGFLSMQLAQRCPGISTLELFEADANALEPQQRNMQLALSSRPEVSFRSHWHDVTTGLPQGLDAIVTNPPFHLGRADVPALGRAFIQRAAEALTAEGQLWLVANRHLPYETTLASAFRQVQPLALRDGFKLIHAQAPKR